MAKVLPINIEVAAFKNSGYPDDPYVEDDDPIHVSTDRLIDRGIRIDVKGESVVVNIDDLKRAVAAAECGVSA